MVSKEKLKKWYWEDKLSLAKIGKKIDRSPATVSNYMDKHGIERRSNREAVSLSLKGKEPNAKKITIKSFNDDLKKWCSDGYLVQICDGEVYTNADKKIKLKCQCGYEFKSSRDAIKRYVKNNEYYKCPICREKHTIWTYNLVKKYFKKHDCKLLSKKFKNSQQKLKYKCSCGNVHQIKFYHFLQGHRCKNCGRKKQQKKQRRSYEYVKKYLEKHDCELLADNYKNGKQKLKYRCSCGNISYICFDAFKKGSRCNECGKERTAEKLRHSYEYVKKYFKDYDCKLISKEYKNNRQKLKFRCQCGNIAIKIFSDFKRVPMCQKCCSSKGEIKIRKYLKNKKIKFKREFRFDNCRNKQPLPFDFAIFYNNELHYLIEYDGVFHYEIVEGMTTKEDLKAQQKRDEIKTHFCKENDIKLIRIPYWEFENIEQILEEKLTLP